MRTALCHPTLRYYARDLCASCYSKTFGRAATARWRERLGPEGVAEYERNRHIRSTYGLSPEEYDDLKRLQGGVCAICQRDVTLCVDHDHETGRVRGLLCRTCNSAVDVMDLDRAVLYLKGALV